MHFIKFILSLNVRLGIRYNKTSEFGILWFKFNILDIKIKIEAVLKTVRKIKKSHYWILQHIALCYLLVYN